MFTKTVAALGVLVLVGAAGDVSATSPIARCTALKTKAAGVKIRGKMTCYGKAKASAVPVPVVTNCLAKTEAKFATAVAKANTKGNCAGTAAGLEALVDSCVNTLLADLPGDSRCLSTATKACGKAGGCELTCAAKDVTQPGLLASCHLRCDGPLSATITNAGACGPIPTIIDHLHDCRDAIIDAFLPTTPTTSTSTSSSTTTSTTLGSPSGAFVDAS